MRRGIAIRAIGFLAAPAILVAAAAPLRAQTPVRFERVRVEQLDIAIPGVALVTDSAQWATLWRRFGEVAYTDTGRVRHVPPPIDFRRYAVVVMAGSATSACSNAEPFVRGVLEWPDSVVVRLAPREYRPDEVTCGMMVHPIDAVRIPRSARPVVFHGPRGWLPGPARWWDQPDAAGLARMPEAERYVFSAALARDPRTPAATVAAIARGLPPTDPVVASLLLERPDVAGDPRILADLARLQGDAGKDARRLLFDRYGLALARDPRTPVRTLRALLDEFARRDPPPLEMSRALVRHPAVLADRELLRRFAGEVTPHAAIHAQACRAYLARYPAWEPARHVSGRTVPGQWSSSVPCRDLPPPPSARGGGRP